MARLNQNQIFDAPDCPEKEIEIPEWGGSVLVKSLTKAKQEHLRRGAMVNGKLDEEKLQMLLIVHCVIDPPMITGDVDEAAAIEKLRQKSAGAVNRLGLAIAEVCGFSEAAQKEHREGFFRGADTPEG